MNRYGNIVGYHNPIETQRVLTEINSKANLQFIDNSWHNDEVDSLHHEISVETEHKYIELYLPNEEYKEYFLTNENRDELLLTKDLDKVIQFINDGDFYNDEVCRNGKLIKDCNCC